ncbi:flavoprotein [Sordaria sp. MPI-SDFR-AT-0083]|nr:flavoprotein [Sordaria sp. MPI-SDFR-AT-0083]
MLQAIENVHDRQFLASELASPATLVAELAQAEVKNILLAASGSIVKALAPQGDKIRVRIILTQSAKHFLGGQSKEQPVYSSLLDYPHVEAIYDDADEWGPEPWRRGASILHIELRRWADILVVAPLSANTLAKIVNGMSDNLLTSVIRAWDTDSSIDNKKKVIVVAPAMNSAMWRHPITAKQIRVLQEEWGVRDPEPSEGDTAGVAVANGWVQVIMPIAKTLACGDTGGAMASVDTIREAIESRLGLE